MLRGNKLHLVWLVIIFCGTLGVGLLPVLSVQAGPPVCVGAACTIRDTTINDFVQGQFYATGLSLRPGGDGEVQLLPIGLTENWIADAFPLPQRRSYIASVMHNDIIYVIGGFDTNTDTRTEIFTARTAITGPILSPGWSTAATGLPVGLANPAAVVATIGSNTYLYVLGGALTSNTATNTVRYIQLDGTGGFIGGWQTTTALPYPLLGHQVVHRGGRFYLIGGNEGSDNGFTHHNEIYSAIINANGSLGSWTLNANTTPEARSYSAAVIWSAPTGTDYLYSIGGDVYVANNFSATSQVYYAPFNVDGSVGSFQSQSLLSALSSHGAVVNTAQVYVTGGTIDPFHTSPTNTVQSGLFDPTFGFVDLDFVDGAPFIPFNSANALPDSRLYHGTVINSGGHIYVIAGTGSNFSDFATDTIFRGASFGVGSRYARTGNYTSRAINLDSTNILQSLAWNSSLVSSGQTTLTFQYRVAQQPQDLTSAPWNLLGDALPGNNITTSVNFPPNLTGQYFQYRILFSTTTTNTTPVVNNVDLNYLRPTPPDLKVSKSDGVVVARGGDILTYTIRYTNAYALAVNGVFLTETLPVSTTFLGGTAGWTPLGNNLYRLQIGSMAANGTGVATISVRVSNNLPLTLTSFVNTVQIDYDRAFGADENTGDNFAQDTDSVASIDLEIRKGNGTDFLAAGQSVLYTIVYRNLGSDPATGVVITETLGAGLVPVGGTGWTQVGNSYVFNVGTLPGNTVGSVTFAAQVPANISGGIWLSNTATIGFNGADDPSNNVIVDQDWVNLPNVDVFKEDGTAIAAANQNLVYNIIVSNRGGVAAHNVVITETPPAFFTPGTNPGWTPVGGGQFAYTVGDMGPLSTQSIPFRGSVQAGVPLDTLITNTVRVDASDEDPGGKNDNLATDSDLITPNAPDLVITLVEPTTFFATIDSSFNVTIRNDGLAAPNTFFYADVYVGSQPTNRTQLGVASGIGPAGLAPNASVIFPVGPISFTTPGTYAIYVQVDTCDSNFVGPGLQCFDKSYGRIREINEANNLYGPITVTVLPPPPSRIMLPLIFR